uniref:G-protein coupled receptors family 1 profile domain-containing protein n=1 Tax=Biomphalaria glabrata TaxID=6526 RepID=A0A2C9M6R8_BIOGL
MNYSSGLVLIETPGNKSSLVFVSTVGVVSQAVLDIVLLVNLDVLGELLGLAGIAANVIVIRVFVLEGFKDGVNISLVSLALSDLGALITLQLYNVMVNPWLAEADLPFLPLEVQSLYAFYPHNYFSRVRGFVTAFVTLERCLCVAWPLKVKQLLTNRVSFACNASIYLIMVLNVSPNYIMTYCDWKFVKSRNRTLYGILYRPNKDLVFSYTYFVTDFFIPFFAFFIVLFCTIVIVITLRSKALWRKSFSSAGEATGKGIPGKERKVMLMISAVSVIFIVCFIPFCAILTARALVPGMGINGTYWNLVLLVGSVAFFMETVNCSISIVVYFKMSSKFRARILEMFTWVFGNSDEKC